MSLRKLIQLKKSSQQNSTAKTPLTIKMDANEPLLAGNEPDETRFARVKKLLVTLFTYKTQMTPKERFMLSPWQV